VCVVSQPGRRIETNERFQKYITFATSPDEVVEACISLCTNEKERRCQTSVAYKWYSTSEFSVPDGATRIFEKYPKRQNEQNRKQNKKKKKKRKKHNTYIPHPVLEAENNHDPTTGQFSLLLPSMDDEHLPCVSIITPTFNRRSLFPIAIRNWLTTDYPREKLEWVIVDDGKEQIDDLLPNDSRIKYVKLTETDTQKLPLSMGEKRNRCVEEATYKYIVHMDDDDHYFPEHVLSRVKVLMKYSIGCTGCSAIGSYDFNTGHSSFITNGSQYFTESTMGFTKEFWKKRPFYPMDRSGEYRKFLAYREKEMRSIPFQFVSIAFTHNTNTTTSRQIKDKGKYDLFSMLFDAKIQHFYNNIIKNM